MGDYFCRCIMGRNLFGALKIFIHSLQKVSLPGLLPLIHALCNIPAIVFFSQCDYLSHVVSGMANEIADHGIPRFTFIGNNRIELVVIRTGNTT